MIFRPDRFRNIPGNEPPREPTEEEREGTMAYFLARHREYAPKIDDFKDVIPEIEIARDQKYVRTREAGFDQEAGVRSKFLEALLASTEAAEANWFGTDEYPLFMVQTTRLDDIANGVDLVWEWKTPEGKIIRLAVDVTVSDEERRLTEKLEKIKAELASQTLGQVKYFSSEIHEGGRGPIHGIPHVVVGTDAAGVDRLVASLSSIPRIDRRLAVLTEAGQKRNLTAAEKDEQEKLDDELTRIQGRLELNPIAGLIFEQMQEQLANQIIDEVTLFLRVHELGAFRGGAEDGAQMENMVAKLRNFMDRFASSENFRLERIEFFESLESVLKVIKLQDAVIGENIVRLLEAYRFMVELEQKKIGVSGIAYGEGRRSKTHQVLTRPWLNVPRPPGNANRAN